MSRRPVARIHHQLLKSAQSGAPFSSLANDLGLELITRRSKVRILPPLPRSARLGALSISSQRARIGAHNLCWLLHTSTRRLCTAISLCDTITPDSRTDELFSHDRLLGDWQSYCAGGVSLYSNRRNPVDEAMVGICGFLFLIGFPVLVKNPIRSITVHDSLVSYHGHA
jgi:hypothetical protein